MNKIFKIIKSYTIFVRKSLTTICESVTILNVFTMQVKSAKITIFFAIAYQHETDNSCAPGALKAKFKLYLCAENQGNQSYIYAQNDGIYK